MESLTFFGVSVEYFGVFEVIFVNLRSFHFGDTVECSDLAQHMQVSSTEIAGIERGDVNGNGGKFLTYLKYAEYVDISWAELFAFAVADLNEEVERGCVGGGEMGKQVARRKEDDIVGGIQTIVQRLSSLGVQVTQQAICGELQLSLREVKKHPRARMILEQFVRGYSEEQVLWRQKRDCELVEKAQQAMIRLRSQGQPITQKSVSQLVGTSVKVMLDYPQARALLSQIADLVYCDSVQQTQEREDFLVEQVLQAAKSLPEEQKQVTQRAISMHVGVSVSNLMYYPRVRVILESFVQDCNQSRLHRSKQYHEHLAQQVATIIEQRNALSEPVTRWSISKELGIPLTRLRRYPPVKLLLDKVGAERQVNLAKRFELRGYELLEQARLAAESLEAKGSPVTPSAIGAALGKMVQHLKRYPKVKDFLSQVEVEYRLNRVGQSQDREDALLEQVMQAIEYLQSSGKQITQQAIGDIVGIKSDGLKYYPKVKNDLKHIAEETDSNPP